MTEWLLLGVAVLLTLGTALFVAAEFSFVALDRSTVERAVEAGDERSRGVLAAIRSLSTQLSGAQVGITVTTLVVGYLAEPSLSRLLVPVLDGPLTGRGLSDEAVDRVAVGVALVAATAFSMVVGELVPKNLAIARAERTARATAAPMTLFMRAFGPVITFFDTTSNKLLRSVGIEPVEELSDVVSLEELDTIIVESMKEGSLDAVQADLLENVLDFRQLKANEVATHRLDVKTIEADASCVDLCEMVASGHSRFPVMDADDQVVGVVHGQSLLMVDRSQWPATTVATLMTPPVVVAETAGLQTVLRVLREADDEMAIVLDEYGMFTGVVTIEDLAEELVGDIQDESDPEPEQVEHPSEQVWVVPGSWRIDEVFDETGVELPTGRYETIAGLVLTELERMAHEGDVVHLDGVRLRVEGVENRRITHVAVDTTRAARRADDQEDAS